MAGGRSFHGPAGGLALLALGLVACERAERAPEPKSPPPAQPTPTAPTQGLSDVSNATPDAAPLLVHHPPGEVLVGTILTPDPSFDAQGAIRAHLDPLNDCYNAALARSPGLRGKMMLRIEVNTSGKVTKAEDEGSALHEPELLRCMLGAIQKVPFPEPKGPAIVTVPLVLRPSAQ